MNLEEAIAKVNAVFETLGDFDELEAWETIKRELQDRGASKHRVLSWETLKGCFGPFDSNEPGEYVAELVVNVSRSQERWIAATSVRHQTPLGVGGSYDFKTPVRMIVSYSNGDGMVVGSKGGDYLDYLLSEVGLRNTCEDLCLSAPDDGLWEFRGRAKLTEDDHTWEGEWSRCTRAQVDAIANGRWDEALGPDVTLRDRAKHALMVMRDLMGDEPGRPYQRSPFENMLGGSTLLKKAREVENLLAIILRDVGGEL